MPTTTHTPTPWQIDYVTIPERGAAIPRVYGDNGDEVLKILNGDEANAPHIVHCVNTHAALVAALEAIFHYDYFEQAIPGKETREYEVYQQAKAALAQERKAP